MKPIAFALVLLLKQESIPGGCVPPACQPYMLQSQMSVPVERGGPQLNKFEKVSSDGHHMLVAGDKAGVPCLMSGGSRGWGVPCLGAGPGVALCSEVPCIIVKTLPSRNFVDGR